MDAFQVAVAACYWVGEAMAPPIPRIWKPRQSPAKTARMLAANAAHLAGLLKDTPCPV